MFVQDLGDVAVPRAVAAAAAAVGEGDDAEGVVGQGQRAGEADFGGGDGDFQLAGGHVFLLVQWVERVRLLRNPPALRATPFFQGGCSVLPTLTPALSRPGGSGGKSGLGAHAHAHGDAAAAELAGELPEAAGDGGAAVFAVAITANCG